MSNQKNLSEHCKIAVAQYNFTVGGLEENTNIILSKAKQAFDDGASVWLSSELALSGYPPEDLLLREDFFKRQKQCLLRLCQELPAELICVIGMPTLSQSKNCYNSAVVIHQGHVIDTYNKQELPNHRVFDEKRYFSPGDKPVVFEFNKVRFGVLICEDAWHENTQNIYLNMNVDVILVLNASPFYINKEKRRYNIMLSLARRLSVAVVYAQCVGAQDELVFDGGSFAVSPNGEKLLQLPWFEESLSYVSWNKKSQQLESPSSQENSLSLEAQTYEALKIGVRDYVNKNNFPGVILGLSGGIDSALTLAIAVDALGANRVEAVMMPTKFTRRMSDEDALKQTELMGVKFHRLPIESIMTTIDSTLSPIFNDKEKDVTEENIQSRIRGLLLMAISNKTGLMVLSTGNKSEMAVGYATLYGDMCGGFSALKDVSKQMVYKLSRYRNTISNVIPNRVIERPPSAELKADQVDQDSLPDYDELDKIISLYVEEDKSVAEIIATGIPEETVRRILKNIDNSEYKRRQAPPGVRITQKGFGKDRRYPITSSYHPYKF